MEALGGHDRGSPTYAASRPRVREAAARVLPKGVDSKLREYCNDAEERTTHRRSRIDVWLSQRPKVDATPAELSDGLDRKTLATCKAI